MGFERETFRIRLLTSFRRILTGTFWKLETTVFIKFVKRCAGSRENPDKAVQPVSTRGWDSCPSVQPVFKKAFTKLYQTGLHWDKSVS